MRLTRFDSMRDIHLSLSKASEAHLPADERRQSFRFTVAQHPTAASVPGIKGGQGHSGAEIERAADTLAMCVSVPAGVALGGIAAAGIVAAADAFGAHLLSRLF